MKNKTRIFIVIFLSALTFSFMVNNVGAENSNGAKGNYNKFGKEIILVFNYLLNKEYPEKFKNIAYKIRPIMWQIIDIDRDGILEIFLLINPHFRQTAPIQIFQLDQNRIERIKEGLAPGRLVKLSGNYMDCHTLGQGIDFLLSEKEKNKEEKIIMSLLKRKAHVVWYKTFIHMDTRSGLGSFIDMRHVSTPGLSNNCENFEFPMPDNIIAGKIKGMMGRCFIASINKMLYIYKISRVKKNGLLDKKLIICKRPDSIVNFISKKTVITQYIQYRNKKGVIVNLNKEILSL